MPAQPPNDHYCFNFSIELLQLVADRSGIPVVFDQDQRTVLMELYRNNLIRRTSADIALAKLREMGYRIVEQIFPQRAYVVTGYPIFELLDGISR